MISRNGRGEAIGKFRKSRRHSRGRMFPNVRLMAASALVSVMALFFAFGVYASLRVSHEPLARSSRAAPLQLVGFNTAMLPVTVLEPFANQQHAPQAAADNGPALAYSSPAPQASMPPPPTVPAAPDTRADNRVDEPAENSDVTQMQITEAPDMARERKPPDATIAERFEPADTTPQSTATVAPPAQAAVTATSPPAAPAAAAEPPQVSPAAERTATIETVPAAAAQPAADDDDAAVDPDIAPKKKKKKHVARRHIYRAPLHAVAQSAAPQPSSSIWPAGIGGPLVTTPKHQ
jgi:hypothetical protein